jgi:hypothetical protein
VEHWLFGLRHLPRSASTVRVVEHASVERRSVGVARPSTLLGPEGTAARLITSVGPLPPPPHGAERHWRLRRGYRPYLKNCTVDASIICSCQVNKGTRWMPWHQEPKKDVGTCDKPRGVGNQT